MSTPASIPHVEAVLACLVVVSLSNCKFSIVSKFCLIVDLHFHPSRALTRSHNSFIPSTWMFFVTTIKLKIAANSKNYSYALIEQPKRLELDLHGEQDQGCSTGEVCWKYFCIFALVLIYEPKLKL